MIIIYAAQFSYIDQRVRIIPMEWFGIVKVYEDDSAIFMQLLPIFCILAICAIQKAALSC